MRNAVVPLVCTGVSLLGLSCLGDAGSEIEWSAQVASPNGAYLVIAQNKRWGGPGNNADATIVYLGHTKSDEEILEFTHIIPPAQLSMKWLGQKCLEVTYGPVPGDWYRLSLQVVRFADIDIVVRERPRPAVTPAKKDARRSKVGCPAVTGSFTLPDTYSSCVASMSQEQGT